MQNPKVKVGLHKKKKMNKSEETTKGVLIPPQFGTGCDIFTPSPISQSINTSLNPHPLFSPILPLYLGSTTGSCIINDLLHRPYTAYSSGMRLLSSEHMIQGLWISASTPDVDGRIIAHVSENGGGIRGSKIFSIRDNVEVNTSSVTKTPSFIGLNGHVTLPKTDSEAGGNADANTFYRRNIGNHKYLSCFGSIRREEEKSLEKTFARFGWDYSTHLSFNKTTRPDQHIDNAIENVPSSILNLGSSARWYHEKYTKRNSTNTLLDSQNLTGISSYLTYLKPKDGVTAAIEIDIPLRKTFINDPYAPHPLPDFSSFMHNIKTYGPTHELSHFIRCKTGKPRISYLFSFDLNRMNDILLDKNDDDHNTHTYSSTSSPYPIIVTCHNSLSPQNFYTNRQNNMGITVSQTLTYDRLIANPLEDRCGKIRNTISWAVQLSQNINESAEKNNDSCQHLKPIGSPSHSYHTKSKETNLTAAVAWQVNRGLCYKIHADSTKGVTFGIICKRWAHPRITASLLIGSYPNRMNSSSISGSNSIFGLKGLNVQVETGPLMPTYSRPNRTTEADESSSTAVMPVVYSDAKLFLYNAGLVNQRQDEMETQESSNPAPTIVHLPFKSMNNSSKKN